MMSLHQKIMHMPQCGLHYNGKNLYDKSIYVTGFEKTWLPHTIINI